MKEAFDFELLYFRKTPIKESGASEYLFSEIRGGYTDEGFEYFAEIGKAVKAGCDRHVGDGGFGIIEQNLCPFDAILVNKVGEIAIKVLFEQTTKI